MLSLYLLQFVWVQSDSAQNVDLKFLPTHSEKYESRYSKHIIFKNGPNYVYSVMPRPKKWFLKKVQLHVFFSKNVWTLPKCYMHIFNVSITNVQSLKNVNLKVWEDLITKSKYHLFKTCWKRTKFNYMQFFRKMSEHFQNVTYTSSIRP
jgi:hypothetical protein